MAIQDAPDGTLWTQIVDVVVDTPVPPSPAHETAITHLGRVSTSEQTYQTIVTWTVTTAKVGVLLHVEMESDDYDHTNFELSIAGVSQFTNKYIRGALSLEWPNVKLAAAAIVVLKCKSTDGTAIVVDGDITGKEVG